MTDDLLAGLTAALVRLEAEACDDRIVRLGQDLWRRWNESHRDYHGPSHLRSGLAALATLGGGPLEVVAWWFHDAVHHNDPPWDEQKSADLAGELLAGLVPDEVVTEVSRLVLLTINHNPGPGDAAGQRLCDADLVLIAADWPAYLATLASLRAERRHLAAAQWDDLRIRHTGALLNRRQLFHTRHGLRHWEEPARRNLTAERQALFAPTPTRASRRTPTEEPRP